MDNKYFIIDFDSTFTQVEALDELGEISLNGNPDKAKLLQEIVDLTNQAMDGKASFSDNLIKRLNILKAHKNHIDPLIEKLKTKVSKSAVRNRSFFKDYADQILIVFFDDLVSIRGFQ